jgi:7-carboxy-7-deazaguanine synthase
MPMPLMINEIFYSIQGESVYAGCPCTFIRLTGCNLRCTYCDTRYAYESGAAMSLEEIAAELLEFPCRLVEITGGEPLMQKETPQLVHYLLEKGYRVLVETNGSFNTDCLDSRCVKIVDIKCPGSGEVDACDLGNLERLSAADQVKFVLCDRQDYAYAKNVRRVIPPVTPSTHILFSPAAGRLDPVTLSRWILQDGLNVRLHLQLHKILWPDVERGV